MTMFKPNFLIKIPNFSSQAIIFIPIFRTDITLNRIDNNEETERVAVFETEFDGPANGQCPANSGLFEWEYFWTIL